MKKIKIKKSNQSPAKKNLKKILVSFKEIGKPFVVENKKIAYPVIAFFVIFFVISIYLLSHIGSTGDGSRKINFVISSGSGPSLVSNQLYKTKLIKSKFAFRVIVILRGLDRGIKKGIYTLSDGMNNSEIIDIITSGKTKIIKVMVPEGFNNRQIGDLFKSRGFFSSRKEFLQISSSKQILKKFNIPANSSEGYLFPDTYYIPLGYAKEKIINLMLETFVNKTSNIKNFPKDNKKRHKLLVLASIVEREAKIKKERPLIAGVFLNRLKENYPLESCATVQYLFPKPKRRLLFRDLKIKSPYNTYIHKGLPPGPIASPGILSIKAALNPIKTGFKYFVLKGNGQHKFSKTFKDHLIAKNKYIPKK